MINLLYDIAKIFDPEILSIRLKRLRGINPNQPDSDGMIPLHKACEQGNVGVVKELLKHPGININQYDALNEHALSYAIRKGHTAIVEELLNYRGIDVNYSTSVSRASTCFLDAVHEGNDEIALKLINHHSFKINQPNYIGRTPLHTACLKGNVILVKALLEHKEVSINTKDRFGTSPLSCAIGNPANFAIMQILVKDQRTNIKEYITELGSNALGIKEYQNFYALALQYGRITWEEFPESMRAEMPIAVYAAYAASFFAPVVFLSDDLVRIAQDAVNSHASRFLQIAQRLPMELQMALCHRVVESKNDNIPAVHVEKALRNLAEQLPAAKPEVATPSSPASTPSCAGLVTQVLDAALGAGKPLGQSYGMTL